MEYTEEELLIRALRLENSKLKRKIERQQAFISKLKDLLQVLVGKIYLQKRDKTTACHNCPKNGGSECPLEDWKLFLVELEIELRELDLED